MIAGLIRAMVAGAVAAWISQRMQNGHRTVARPVAAAPPGPALIV